MEKDPEQEFEEWFEDTHVYGNIFNMESIIDKMKTGKNIQNLENILCKLRGKYKIKLKK